MEGTLTKPDLSGPREIANQNDAASPDTAIVRLKSLVRADLTAVNDEIVERMASHVPMIPALAAHLVESGGKRLRPMLTLAAARACGYDGVDHVRLAAAVEFIHTATLLHDDVVDESVLRRGSATANVIWGNQASVLVGDFLFSRAFELMVDVGDLKVLQVLSRASSVIAEGEVMQLAAQKDLSSTLETYLKVVESKTAALFAAAAQVGALVALRQDSGQAPEIEVGLRAYGRNLGVAYQLVDDALDYSGRQASLGKSVGDDFRESKMTLPVVLAFARAGDEEKAFWRRAIGEGRQTDSDFDEAVALMERHGVIAETFAYAKRYASRAKSDLEALPDGAYRQALLDIADFSVARAH